MITPGPWEWWTSCSWKRLTSKDAAGRWMREGNVLCPSIASDGHAVLDISEENMALIAAAPDLLAALKFFVENIDPVCLVEDDHPQRNLADLLLLAIAAIAKAEGKP